MNFFIHVPVLALSCLGFVVVPVCYVIFCLQVAFSGAPPIKPLLYAILCIGGWWLALALGTRPFNAGAIFMASLVPDFIVLGMLLACCQKPEAYRELTLKSGLLYPLVLGLLYLSPAALTDQEFPVLREPVDAESLPGVYVMSHDTAIDMVRQGYTDTSGTITLYSNHTFKATKIADAWIGGGPTPGYDSFSGAWASTGTTVSLTIRKVEPGSAWKSPDMWYDNFIKEGYFYYTVNLTRQRGQTNTYALAVPIANMDDQGDLVFVRQ